MKRRVGWCSDLVEVPGVAVRSYDSETAFQIYCADWLRKQFEITGNESFDFWHHSSNEREGGKAGFFAKMKGQGKGYPDFVHCGLKLAIELKIVGGVTSKDQERWLAHFRKIGWQAEVVRTFERFRNIVLNRIFRDSKLLADSTHQSLENLP